MTAPKAPPPSASQGARQGTAKAQTPPRPSYPTYPALRLLRAPAPPPHALRPKVVPLHRTSGEEKKEPKDRYILLLTIDDRPAWRSDGKEKEQDDLVWTLLSDDPEQIHEVLVRSGIFDELVERLAALLSDPPGQGRKWPPGPYGYQS